MKRTKRLLIALATLLIGQLAVNAQPQTFDRTVVVEEFTGTWCGWCPRGIVGLDRLQQDFGDRVICIAVHQGDDEPMAIATYPDLVPGGGGIPAAMIDRGDKTDPYAGSAAQPHYGINADVQARMNVPAEAGLQLTAQWADAMQWDVRFTVSTTFGISSDDAPYALAFILLEDDLTGDGKKWAQCNYYKDNQDYADDDMKFWREADEYVGAYRYSHVPVNTLGIKNGIAGSIKAPIESGQTQTYSDIVTTLNNKVIQNKSCLSAVALLLNTKTGRIVNAAKATIGDTAGMNGLMAPDSAKGNGKSYTLGGLPVRNQASPNSHSPRVLINNGKKYIK